ncbi:MAG: hypothetical protein V4683_08750 [Bacteroidota bacterium]
MIKPIAILACGALLWVGCTKDDFISAKSQINTNDAKDVLSATGNGAPSGAHYTLNIIGMAKGKTADMTGDNGHRIFMPLWGTSKIMLNEGPDFMVLDGNGTDGTASFQLPNPDPDGDGTTSYSIWMRALGTPGGKAVVTTCADADLTDGYYEVCSSESLNVERTRGASKFTNVTRTLLTILIDDTFTFTDGDGVEVEVKAGRYTIFDPIFEDYFWKYDNAGLKLLQLRFYPIPTSIL